MGLLEALPALVAGELQLRLSFVFGHVVLEGRALAALEPTDLTPAKGKGGSAPAWCCLAQPRESAGAGAGVGDGHFIQSQNPAMV